LHAADSMLLSHIYIIAHPEVSFSDGLFILTYNEWLLPPFGWR
jgi:hypothetical protein